MMDEVESGAEAAAFFAAMGRLAEGGYAMDDPDEHVPAFERIWIAGRDYHARTAGGDAGEAARLKAALEWYADPSNYDRQELYSDDPRLREKGVTYWFRPVADDEGERARAALAPTGGDGSGE
jgi:hypothetical protein